MGFGKYAAMGGVSLAALIGGLRSVTARRDRAQTDDDPASVGRAASDAIRVMRLAAQDLRSEALLILGHAEAIADAKANPARNASAIIAATAHIMTVADDLQDHAVGPASARVLRAETVELGPLLNDVVSAVATTLGGSRRTWRLPGGPAPCALFVDRRALRQILLRVVTNAARFSNHDDWIDISIHRETDGLTIVIEDEGAGTATPEPVRGPARVDSRGIGLGLLLARSLMEAHGGRLLVEAASHVGTRVSLCFPGPRVV